MLRSSLTVLLLVAFCSLAVPVSAAACVFLSDSSCLARSLPCVAEWQWRTNANGAQSSHRHSHRHSDAEDEDENEDGTLSAAAFPSLLVTLRVFSGSNDPQWILNSSASQSLISSAQRAEEEQPMRSAVMESRVLGYFGFLLSCPYSAEGVLIRGESALESFLLEDISHRQQTAVSAVAGLSAAVLEHVASHVGDSAQLDEDALNALSRVPVTAYTMQLSGFAAMGESNPPLSALAKNALQLPLLKVNGASDERVDSSSCVVPVVGPDYPPYYDPQHDDGGCFITDQTLNNCYAYGCDIVTDTFPQPGRGSGQKWTENTCDNMGAASVRDGLEYVGTTLPSAPPAKNGTGHYVALLIWPDTNFHWIRMDANNDNSTGVPVYYWSHKPGQTPVRNVDNNGQLITNPAVSDFSPWTQFCAYYRAQPSVLTIN